MVLPSPRTLWILIGCLAVFNLLAFREWRLLPDGKLHFYAFDVGQGDSLFLVSPSGKQILIDGGPDLSTLEGLGHAMPFLDRNIDLLIMTHPDKDHISALPEVLRRYDVANIMLTGVEHDLGRYEEFIALAPQEHANIIVPDPKKDIDMGDGLLLDIVWPDANTMDPHMETNESSIVLRALYKDHEILLTGDAERKAEHAILQSGADINSDILKLGHHGSRTSSSLEFLKAVTPDLAIVSAGKNNQYGHPHKEVIDRLKTLGVPVRSTQAEGTVAITLD